MAGNCINFAIRVLQAANALDENGEPSNGAVRGIAIAVATFTCFVHAFSRRGGILLNNILALVKLCILFFIIITAIVVAAGGLSKTENIISKNTSIDRSFDKASNQANAYASAFLAVSKFTESTSQYRG
jgi:amino acid transporter